MWQWKDLFTWQQAPKLQCWSQFQAPLSLSGKTKTKNFLQIFYFFHRTSILVQNETDDTGSESDSYIAGLTHMIRKYHVWYFLRSTVSFWDRSRKYTLCFKDNCACNFAIKFKCWNAEIVRKKKRVQTHEESFDTSYISWQVTFKKKKTLTLTLVYFSVWLCELTWGIFVT